MDRRFVSGFLGLAIVASGQGNPTWAGDRAPAPLPIGPDSLPPLPGEAAPPRPARIPPSPMSSPPVGMTDIPSIRGSINGGLAPGYVPASRRPAPRAVDFTRNPAPRPLSASSLKDDPAAVPSNLVDGPDLMPSAATTAPGQAIPAGRPAPYAGQVPTAPRVQAAPAATPSGGRPAPYAADKPSGPRPQAPASLPPAPAPDAEAPPALDPVSPRAESPPDLPSVEVASPASAPAPTVTAAPRVAASTPAPASPADPAVVATSNPDATALRSSGTARSAPIASRRAAAVGDEVITMHELELAVNELVRSRGDGQKPDRATLNMIASRVLDKLIDESLIVQEAQRKMGKNAAAQTRFNQYAEDKFREMELTPMLRKAGLSNEYELNKKLVAETGRSLADMREKFKREITAQDFLYSQIHSKVSADVYEMRDYYNQHLGSFDRPAQVTWHEVEIDARKTPNRADARQKAEAALDRLRRGEPFEQVARSVSDGATAKKGGLWETTPGGFGDPAINAALDQLPTGQVSQIMEGPTSFRILRVDARREAGPARFDEVQDQIRTLVFEANYAKARDEYLSKLRQRTLVVTIFDRTESAPALSREDPAVRAASAR